MEVVTAKPIYVSYIGFYTSVSGLKSESLLWNIPWSLLRDALFYHGNILEINSQGCYSQKLLTEEGLKLTRHFCLSQFLTEPTLIAIS